MASSKPIIFREGIVCPPSDPLAIRAVCLYITTFTSNNTDFLLETEKENKDIYYNWIKRIHLNDFIDEIIEIEEEVYGLRIGEKIKKRPYLTFDRVSWENVQTIISLLS